MAKKKKRGVVSNPKTSSTTAATALSTKRHNRTQHPAKLQLKMREHTTAGKIAWWTLLILVFLVPILFGSGLLSALGLSFADSFDTVKVLVLRIGTMIALAAWIWDVLSNGGEIRLHKVYWVVGALLIWITVSTAVSVSPATAFFGKYRRYDGAWSYALYALLFFLTIQYATSYARVKQIAQALSWSSLIVAGYGLLQAFGLDPMNWGTLPFEVNRSFSSYGNPDLLAGFLAFGVFVNLGLILSEKRREWRIWYWVVFLINAAVVITAFSRSIWVASVVGFILIVVFALVQHADWAGIDWGFSGGVLAVVVAFIVRSLSSNDSVMNFATRLKSIFDFNTGSSVTRFEIWEAARKAIAERPLFGFGSDTFRLVFRRFAPPAYSQDAGYRSVADNVHNFPLQLAAGIGIIGALFFYVAIGWVIVLAAKACLKHSAEGSHRNRMLFAGLVTACVTYNVHLFFGLSLPGSTFLLWILLGALLVPHTRRVYVQPVTWAKPAALAATVLLCVPITFAARLAIADHYFMVEKNAVAQTQPDAAIAAIKKTMKYNPFLEIYLTDWVTVSADETIKAVQNQTVDAAQRIADTEALCNRLIKLSPWEYDSYLMVTSFYSRLGETMGGEQGRAYLQKSADLAAEQIKKTPDGLALRYTYAITLQSLGEAQEAEEQLSYCVDHDSNFADAATALASLTTPTETSATP